MLPINSGPSTKIDAAIVSIELDALITETPTVSATPTSNTIEDGSVIADHVTHAPDTLTIQGEISNSPASIDRIFSKSFVSSPVQDSWEQLLELKRDGVPFDFVSDFQVYYGYVITNLTPTRNAAAGQALNFSCTMQKITIVESEVVDVPEEVVAEDVKATAASESKAGTTPTKAAPAAAESNGSSILNNVIFGGK